MPKNKIKKKRNTRSIKSFLKHKLLRKRNIICLLSLLINIILIIFICYMNILPLKYTLLVTITALLITLIGTILINVHRKIVLKVIGGIIILISIIGNSITLYYLVETNSFIINSFTNKETYVKNTYYVLSKKSNNFKKSDLLNASEIATYKETAYLDDALDKLNDKYSLKEKEYSDLGELFDNLNNDTDKFILVEKSSYEIVFSLDTSLSKTDYDILYEFNVYTARKASENTNSDKFNIYVGGTDFAGLMDYNAIITVNKSTHTILLTSIPRDYYIEVVGKDGRYDKLSYMNAYGADTNKKSLEKLFNITIDYSVILDTNSLVTLVDYLGGIEFCSDYDFTTTHALVTDTYDDSLGEKLTITKGCHTLNGVEMLTVARERNAFPGRDRIRQKNCQKILISIIKKLESTDTLLHYNETLNTLSTIYETDIPKKVVTDIIKDYLNTGSEWTIETQSVDGVDDHDYVHLSNILDWVMYPDTNTVEEASNKITSTLNK
jgi:LCP family protein required for cell wall assembly